MPINEIELTKPVKLDVTDEADALYYLTHSIWTTLQDEPFALIADYSNDPVRVWPARYDREQEMFIGVSEELGKEIGDYIDEHGIEVLTLEQVKEVEEHE